MFEAIINRDDIISGLSLKRKKSVARLEHEIILLEDSDRARVASILEAVGLAVEVKEDYMDAITGIAGSSPAFLYMVIDAMADWGESYKGLIK